MRPLLLVLTVINDATTRSFAREILEGAGHRVVEASGRTQAQSLLINGLDPDLLLCEGSMFTVSESASFRQLFTAIPARRVCLIYGAGDRELRDEAARCGVSRLMAKPITRGDLDAIIEQAGAPNGDHREDGFAAPSRGENGASEPRDLDFPAVVSAVSSVPYIEELDRENFFLAASPQMIEIHRQVKLLADIDVNVLILGESGTGKEVIAQLIHKNSRRSNEKLLKVNCAALPAELLESELFGHRQGAFTGAINDRQGKFEQANRGTLLLDEIGEIGIQMQAKLLHVLQDGQFARLGAQEITKVDVRVLAATNIQIEDAILARTFREDLFYRLNVFTIKVPPLRERSEEIPFLMEQMIRRAPVEMTRGAGMTFPARLMDAALAYDWRGNVRELRNFVTRAIIMRDPQAATRELEEKAAASAGAAPQQHPSVDTSVPCAGIRSIVRDIKDRTETQVIQDALDAFGWNRRRTAQYLNLSYRALLYKIQQYRLKPSPAADPLQLFQRARFARQGSMQRTGPEMARLESVHRADS